MLRVVCADVEVAAVARGGGVTMLAIPVSISRDELTQQVHELCTDDEVAERHAFSSPSLPVTICPCIVPYGLRSRANEAEWDCLIHPS